MYQFDPQVAVTAVAMSYDKEQTHEKPVDKLIIRGLSPFLSFFLLLYVSSLLSWLYRYIGLAVCPVRKIVVRCKPVVRMLGV